MQPLISDAYGKGQQKEVRQLLRVGLLISGAFAILFVMAGYLGTDSLIGIFNSEQSAELLRLAHTGLRLYFLGFLVAGINVQLISYFSATGAGRMVVTGSLLRGLILNTVSAFVLSRMFGVNGVWISYLVAEGVTILVLGGMCAFGKRCG